MRLPIAGHDVQVTVRGDSASEFQMHWAELAEGMGNFIESVQLTVGASNAGALGLIGAGSMKPDLLKQHIIKAKSLTNSPIGVNLPLLYHGIDEQIGVCLEQGIKIFFTSAGSPKKFTTMLKSSVG